MTAYPPLLPGTLCYGNWSFGESVILVLSHVPERESRHVNLFSLPTGYFTHFWVSLHPLELPAEEWTR